MSESRDVFQIEIRVRDLQASMKFDRETFDWGVYQSSPAYALVDTGRMPVVGLLQDPRLPLGVCPNILVPDCTAAVEKAAELGGRVYITRSVVEGSGAFTAALDPWGNEIFFWQPSDDRRPNPKHDPTNPFVFMEIATPNVEKATEFYKALLGWSFWNVAFLPNYAMAEGCGLERGIGLYGGDASASGIVSYIKVANLEETSAKIQRGGGQVVVPPTDFPGEGRYIMFADIDGNRLGAIELSADKSSASGGNGAH
jgi:predicted enzyme related to lactoylglutathione lyase